ncbi:FAD/NAD(P)-binding domain-containing protein [Hypoxylon sp. NC1633]|nr:FAD/NAD(P)-binding domain-containing protein [Hypoxylon sp. NC1633]
MARMKVLISGGGIAGNALAFWLSKLGHDVTVVEWFHTLRATGLQIDLRGHGIEVMKRMGLEQAFRSMAVPEQGLQVVDGSGRRRAFFPANKSGKGLQSFTSEFEIMRGDLCRLLYDRSKDRARYIFGTSIQSFEDRDGSVEVRLADGAIECFDLLVGADGVSSRTRRMMLGPDTPDPFFPIRGQFVGYFTMPRPIQEGDDSEYIATAYIAPGKRGIMTRRHSPDAIQVYAGCTTDAERLNHVRRGDVQEEKEALAEALQGAGWQTPDLVGGLMAADDFYLENLGVVRMQAWSRGRVALLGDAAYCPSANTGMGTTSAIVGAYVLAGEIERHCGPASQGVTDTTTDANGGAGSRDGLEAALRAYEDTFRPFMTQVVKDIDETSPWSKMMPSTPFGVSVLYFLVGVASFLRLNVIANYILREGIKWDLPEYKEILRD